MLTLMNENGLMSAFSNVSLVLKLSFSVMISNCLGESLFSVLQRARNQLRSAKGQKTMN